MGDDTPMPLSFSDVTLRHLKFKPLLIFDRVLQRRSILRAARELHFTQSAVTKAVRELEDEFGIKLFAGLSATKRAP
jgi:DNA-binding transcriptional LysR family regulator